MSLHRFVILKNRMENITPTRVEGLADLVVEVASAGTRSYDMGEKAGVYEEGDESIGWWIQTAVPSLSTGPRDGR